MVNLQLKFKLVVTNDPVVEELEFETLEQLQARVAELSPKPAEGEEG